MDSHNSHSDTYYLKPSTFTSRLTQSEGKNTSQSSQYPAVVIVYDRIGVLDQPGAIITSTVLEDLEKISKTRTLNVVDRHKIRREKKIWIEYQQGNERQVKSLDSYLDGKKDHTLMQESVVGKKYMKTDLEEHITMIKEPESKNFASIIDVSNDVRSHEE